MVLFLPRFNLPADLNRTDAIGDNPILLLMIERRPIEI